MIVDRYIVLIFLNSLTPICVGFILCIYLYIIIKSEGTVRKKSIFLFIGLFLLWMWAFTDLIFKNQQKIIVGIYAIIGIAFDIYLIYYLFIVNDPSIIGELTGVLDTTYNGIAAYYSIFIVLTLLITGILFGHESLKSDNLEIKLKGKLLIIAFFSAISFYCGFLLPGAVKKIFLKED